MWNAQEASYGPLPSRSGVEEWTSKHGDNLAISARNYALEVAQHPVRARMCGFGDKDRRPLAPAAIARLIVTDKNDVPVPPESIQVAFFIVLVDLWDEQGLRATNLVRVPLPTGITSRRYKVQRADSLPASQRQNGAAYSFSDPQVNAEQNAPIRDVPPLASTSSPTHQRKTSNGQQLKRKRGANSIDDSDPRNIIRVESENTRTTIEEIPTRPFYATPDAGFQANFTPPDLIPFNSFFPPYSLGPAGMSYLPADTTESLPPEVTNPPSYQTTGEHSYLDNQPQPWPAEEPTEYARTLIGPLAAGAQTLNDNNDEPGIFFLFQDLSVRTEGVFRLRMRLVNVGGPPAPDPGASYVRSDDSTVLAQVFTDPFTVFSPKKFPGVPSQTLLSQRLLQQGLKIPGRTRFPNGKGATNSRRKRRKTDTEEWMPGNDAASNSEEE